MTRPPSPRTLWHRKVRCPRCGRVVRLRGRSASVIPPHTTRRGILLPDGTLSPSGPPCPASMTRLAAPWRRDVTPPIDGGAA